MKNIVIFGSGYHSKVVFTEIIKLNKYNIVGFIDDRCSKNKIIISYKKKKYKNLGSIKNFVLKRSSFKKYEKEKISGIIGVGLNYLRKKIRDEVFKFDKKFEWETIISINAVLNGKIDIGKGTLIMPGVIINTGSRIGEHVIINTSSSIDHDNKFNNFSSCGPGVITGGNVSVGNSSFLGIGSLVKQNISIGNHTVIGGGSYVNKNCLNKSVYFGVPIKKIKSRKVQENYLK